MPQVIAACSIRFSPAPGDVANPLFYVSKATYVLQNTLAGIGTVNDARFLAKFGRTSPPPSGFAGAQYASAWAYVKNIGRVMMRQSHSL